MKYDPAFESLVEKLYRVKNPTTRVKKLIDDLSFELVGETFRWRGDKTKRQLTASESLRDNPIP